MAQAPVYAAADEEALMTRLWAPSIANDPLAFVMLAFPWGEKGTPLEHFVSPRRWQKRVLNDIKDHIKANQGRVDFETFRLSVASGRGSGKSALLSWILLWFVTTRIGSSSIVSANSETQLRSVTFAEITKWSSMAIHKHWFEIASLRITPAVWLSTLVEKDLKIGARAWGIEGRLWSAENPSGFAGLHNNSGVLVVFDEASNIDDAIFDVAQGFFTENNPNRFWVMCSNPRRNQGYFFQTFNDKRDFWRNLQIDSREVEGTDKQIYASIIAEYGANSYQAKVEVYGEFASEGDDQFVSSDIAEAAMKRPRYKDELAPIAVGVDPARFGADASVIAIRQGRDILEIRRFQGIDTMELVGQIIQVIDEFKPAVVAIDDGGLGAGVVDRLREQRYKIRPLNFGNRASNPRMYGNKRAEIWGVMREWLRTASIPDDRRLKSDITGPKVIPDSSGVVFLEKKSAMKARGLASPDAADAIALSLAFPVAHRDTMHTADRKRADFILTQPQNKLSWMGH